MIDEPKTSLVWNAEIRRLLLEGQPVIAAFKTLKFILSEAGRPDAVGLLISQKTEEPETAAVPLWALQELVERWNKYEGTNDSLSFGQVFGLEGSGGGKHKTLARHMRMDGYVGHAIEVTKLVENGTVKTQAIEIVAHKHGIEPDALRKALEPPKPS